MKKKRKKNFLSKKEKKKVLKNETTYSYYALACFTKCEVPIYFENKINFFLK